MITAATMSPVCALLLQTFNPGGGAAALRSCAERAWDAPGAQGDRITLQFDLLDAEAREQAASLARTADVIADYLQLGGFDKMLADLSAWINADNVFTVDALVLKA